MKIKPFRLEILLCQVALVVVMACMVGCSVFLALNIYTIYAGHRGVEATGINLHLNTQTKNIELCKPDVFTCANLR